MTDYDLQAWARRMNNLDLLRGTFDQYLIGNETFEHCAKNAIELLLPFRARELDKCRQECGRLEDRMLRLTQDVASLMSQLEKLKNI